MNAQTVVLDAMQWALIALLSSWVCAALAFVPVAPFGRLAAMAAAVISIAQAALAVIVAFIATAWRMIG